MYPLRTFVEYKQYRGYAAHAQIRDSDNHVFDTPTMIWKRSQIYRLIATEYIQMNLRTFIVVLVWVHVCAH